MTTGFVFSLGPVELARLCAHDPTDRIIAALDGIEPESLDIQPITLAEIEPYLDRLPDVEADMVSMRLLGKRQVDIAEVMGVTQAAVSYRLLRAAARIRFFRELPELDEAEVRAVLERNVPVRRHIEIMMSMWRTSCQTATAAELRMSQGQVRHVFLACVDMLDSLAQLDPTGIETVAKAFRLLSQHPNILHETRLPHWVSRRRDLLA